MVKMVKLGDGGSYSIALLRRTWYGTTWFEITWWNGQTPPSNIRPSERSAYGISPSAVCGVRAGVLVDSVVTKCHKYRISVKSCKFPCETMGKKGHFGQPCDGITMIPAKPVDMLWVSLNHYWLVVYLPLWKIRVRQLGWLFPIYGKS
jgi:hypothetical protein